ncbi:rhomboid-like protein [Streptomyces sp. NPDC059788]|uniref:rhomboid-like protein n=1 Tax=Streptomyces sp. NPDC059788 TaxID=3346948 RepID=UPI003657E443
MRRSFTHLAGYARRYGAYVRRAPGTHLWLLLLLASTEVVRHASAATAHRILELHSTNLHHLAHDPARVLITSAWYLAGGNWLLHFALYNLFHVPLERRLGTFRWLAVVLITHIGATYLSQGALDHTIHLGQSPQGAEHTLDYGVSYALAGMQAVLTYLIARPWRYLYAAALVLVYGIALAVDRDFTGVGHLDAVLLGFACYPLVRGRTGYWNPVTWSRAQLGRARRAPVLSAPRKQPVRSSRPQRGKPPYRSCRR